MRRALTGVLVAAAAYPIGSAQAQSRDDLARAETLFNAGKALTDGGQYGDACAKFAESKRLAPGLGVTLYLADCYEHIGRTASAWTEFLSAEGLARDRNDKRADVAKQRAHAIEPKLNRLTILLAPTIPRSGLQVLRDGNPVAQEELGLAVPVDPGDHAVVVSSPDHKPRGFAVHVGAESPTATVEIDSLDERPSNASPAVVTPAPPGAGVAVVAPVTSVAPTAEGPTPPSSSAGATRRWIGLGVGGLGVVGIGIGSALGLSALSKRDQSNASPTLCDANDVCSPQGHALRQDAKSAADASTVAFAIGAVALASGIVLYVTAPRTPHGAALVVVPTTFTAGGGALVRGTF